MRKILCTTLIVVILFGMMYMFSGCGKSENEKDEKSETSEFENVTEKYEDGILDYTFDKKEHTAKVSGAKSNIGRDSIKEIIIPNCVEKDGEKYKVVELPAFSYSSRFKSLKNLETIKIAEGISIGEYAFMECESLTSIRLPSDITKIPDNAFYGCKNLVSIDIPDSVTEIGENAFYECSKLKNVHFPDSLTLISSCAFADTNVENIQIPDKTTKIDSSAFASCTNLKKITLPKSATYIGRRAFGDCSNLSEITIPDSVTVIENRAFENCSNLTKINIPNGVTRIEDATFRGCTNLQKVTISESVTYIGEGAFEECTHLQEITIPSSVETIKGKAFYGCTNLTVTIKGKSKKTKGFEIDWNTVDYKDGKNVNIIWDSTAPSNADDSEKSFEEKQVESLSPVSWKYDKIDFSNLKWLNTEKLGNICIPNNWEIHTDIVALATLTDNEATAYGLSDASQMILIKDCSPEYTNIEMENLLSQLSADTKLEEWSSEKIEIEGKNAVIVNAKLGGINHIQSTMFILNKDNSRMNIISVEAPDPDVRKLLNTFIYDKVDEDATSFFKNKSMTQN